MMSSPAGLLPASIPIDLTIGTMATVLPLGATIHLHDSRESMWRETIRLIDLRSVDLHPSVAAILEPSDSTYSMRGPSDQAERATTTLATSAAPLPSQPNPLPPDLMGSPVSAILPKAVVARLDQLAAPLRDQVMLAACELIDQAVWYLTGDVTVHGLSLASGRFATSILSLRDDRPPSRSRPSLRVDPPPSAARADKERAKFRQVLHDLLGVDADPSGKYFIHDGYRYRLYDAYGGPGLVVECQISGGYGHAHVAYRPADVIAARQMADRDKHEQEQIRQKYTNPFRQPNAPVLIT